MYEKPEKAPSCPTNLPQCKTLYTAEQTESVVTWMAFLPLIELRKRQIIAEQQMVLAYERYNQGERTDYLLMAMDNLFSTQEHLDSAIDFRIFEWNLEQPTGELLLIPSEWSQSFMLKCMHYKCDMSKS